MSLQKMKSLTFNPFNKLMKIPHLGNHPNNLLNNQISLMIIIPIIILIILIFPYNKKNPFQEYTPHSNTIIPLLKCIIDTLMILTILIKSIENISHKHSIFFNTVKLNLKCHLKKKSNKKQFNSTPENLNQLKKQLFLTLMKLLFTAMNQMMFLQT
jgi:hypothetical protein